MKVKKLQQRCRTESIHKRVAKEVRNGVSVGRVIEIRDVDKANRSDAQPLWNIDYSQKDVKEFSQPREVLRRPHNETR